MTVHQSNFIHNSRRVDQMWPMGQSLPIFTSAKSKIAHVFDFPWQPCSEYKSQKRLFDISGSVSFLYMLHLNSKRRVLRKSRDWWFAIKTWREAFCGWLSNVGYSWGYLCPWSAQTLIWLSYSRVIFFFFIFLVAFQRVFEWWKETIPELLT